MKKNIIDSNMDDDCQTDDEQLDDAKKMMEEDLEKAITQYIRDKRDGSLANSIKNLDPKRLSRDMFI